MKSIKTPMTTTTRATFGILCVCGQFTVFWCSVNSVCIRRGVVYTSLLSILKVGLSTVMLEALVGGSVHSLFTVLLVPV